VRIPIEIIYNKSYSEKNYSMFDLTNPSIDGTNHTTIYSYPSPYTSTTYRPFTSTPTSPFLFNIHSSINDQQQRLTEFSSYPNPTQDFM
jgi:hypothetical protein